MHFTGTDLAPRRARAIVVIVAAALLSVHIVQGLGRIATDPAAGTIIALAGAGVFLLQLRYLGPRWVNGWTLAVETVLSYAAVGLGASVGVLCVLLAAFLLERAWISAVLTIGSATWIEGVRHVGPRTAADMTSTVALGGLVLFGLTRLAFLVAEVHGARLTLAMAAVTDERLRIAGELDADLAEGLQTIRVLAASGATAAPPAPPASADVDVPSDLVADHASTYNLTSRGEAELLDEILGVARRSLASARGAAAEFRSMSLAPEAASTRALLASAGIDAEVRVGHAEPLGPAGALLAMVLREAVTDVVRKRTARLCVIETSERDGRVVLRVVNDGVRTAELGAHTLDDLASRVTATGGRFATGLERDGRFVVEASVVATPKPPVEPAPRGDLTADLFQFLLAALCVKVLLFLPLHLYVLGVPCLAAVCALQIHFSLHDAVRWGRLGLVALAALAFIPLHWFGQNWIAAPGFLAGSILMAFPAAVSVPLVAATTTVAALITGPTAALNTLITAAVVYGILRLARLVRELRAASADLARAAVVQERLRAARDLHDLLGHSLAAITLKGELAKRLAPTDPARVREELADIAGIAERAQADLRTVVGETNALAFEAELVSAATILAAADVRPEIEPADTPMPLEAGDVLSAVLREAVTNVLRHSAARNCRIAVTVRPDRIRLDVENDGVSAGVTPPGSGVGNLTVRLAELGGTLTAGPDDGWFLLCAELPTAASTSRSPSPSTSPSTRSAPPASPTTTPARGPAPQPPTATLLPERSERHPSGSAH